MNHHNDHDHDPYHDLGLTADLEQMQRSAVNRRKAMRLGLLGLGTILVSSPVGAALNACVAKIPSETAGPYPGDGSRQGVNVLERTGIVRSDIRTSLKTKNVAAGVPLTIELTLVNSNKNCAVLSGYAIYLWHCDQAGMYSMYSQGVTAEDYLRGVQATTKDGKVTFKTIFPACYAGRFPHVHFEVYPSLAKATNASNVVHTSQFAFPETVCNTIYSSVSGYAQSVRNFSQISLAQDNVFSDGTNLQMPTVTGNAKDGYKAILTIGIAV
jgi:protocatechuate 3,4-dioxygenase beta subunit